MSQVKERLLAKGYEIPALAEAKTLFKQVAVSGKTVYVSGQLPGGFGEMSNHVGQIGKDFNLEHGKTIAAYCALNILTQLEKYFGDLDKVKRCLKLTIFVNSVANFNEQHLVANGASEVILCAFEGTDHTRSAFGVAQLPFGVAVEVEGIFEI